MATVPARTVRPGQSLLLAGKPLRVVVPRNFRVPEGDLAPVDANAVFAVDDNSGLYLIRPDEQVGVPFSVPLVLRDDPVRCVVAASFDRSIAPGELSTLRRNFREGRITANPDDDLPLALMQQLALEVRAAYDEGMEGWFQCHRVHLGKCFDREAMGWKRPDGPER